MSHEMRTDFAMFIASLFLMFEGGGRCSMDYRIQKQQEH